VSVATEVIMKAIRVDAPPERAFAVFTEGVAAWWPLRTHSVGGEEAETVVIETHAGGRLYERLRGGRECVWGEILVSEPPHRLVCTWHPGHAEDEPQTEVEVRFLADGEGTRVELEHRYWERLGDRAPATMASYDEGWDFVLEQYRAAPKA
jgi:uncharacterized protein YndB with AHSA1/START domain